MKASALNDFMLPDTLPGLLSLALILLLALLL